MQNAGVVGHHVVCHLLVARADDVEGQGVEGVLDLALVQRLVDLLEPVVRDPATVGERQALKKSRIQLE